MKTMIKPIALVSLLIAVLAQPLNVLAEPRAVGVVFQDALESGSKGQKIAMSLNDYEAGSILHKEAYGYIENLSGGEYIPVSYLYNKNNAAQTSAIRRAFSDENGRLYDRVTREEVYAFVRQQFDLYAIKELSGKVPGEGQDIEDFIAANRATLRGVTQALYEGRLSIYCNASEHNFYARDLGLMFKSFGRPDLTDPLIRNTLNHLQGNAKIFPTAHYALNKMTDAELIAITGKSNFIDLAATQQHEILNGIFKQGYNAFAKEDPAFPAYNRVVLNYYEDSFSMANFAWHRSGALDDTGMQTFNGRYGPPTQDMLMHTYMRYHDRELKTIFSGEQASIFMNRDRTAINYDVTYEEVMARLSPENQATLQAGMSDLARPSLHTYHRLRPGFFYQRRLQ